MTSLSVWMEKSKTDKKKEGNEFVLTKEKVGKRWVTKLIQRYRKLLGDVSEDSVFFPVFRRGKVVEDKAVSYSSARTQLHKNRVLLRLGKITWRSGRIGAAREAAKKKISRKVIMKSGGWKSSAVDIYMRVKDPGLTVQWVTRCCSRLSMVNCQCQLSAVNCQLSTVSCQW